MPIISAPNIAVQRTPTRSAIHPIIRPPTPDPSQANEAASDGIERMPSASAAISLSATAMIHAAPNAIARITRATVATIQDVLVSMEGDVGNMTGRAAFADRFGFG